MMDKPTLNIVLVEPRIPHEHRQRGAHLCLHGLPSASGGPHGLCH